MAISVRIKPDNRQIVMTWDHVIQMSDVDRAVSALEQHLILADEPLTLVVDLSANPRYAVHNAVTRVLKYKAVGSLVIVGNNKQAYITANVLKGLTRNPNIYWYPTLNDSAARIN